MARPVAKMTAQPKDAYRDATLKNDEGFPAFQRSLAERYEQMLVTNTLGGTYYADETRLRDEAIALHVQMIKEFPVVAAELILKARTEGFMRMQPITGLAALAKSDDPLAKGGFKRIFRDVIRTPKDLSDFLIVARGGLFGGPGIGRMIKREVAAWLNSISEYHVVKYASGGQGYALRDMLRVVHPKPADGLHEALFRYLMDQDMADFWGDIHQVRSYVDLKQSFKDGQINRALIEQGKLPYEAITGLGGLDTATWELLMKQMPYMALLRHLNTLQRHGVLDSKANIQYVADRLSDAKAVQKSLVLPFRLFTAYQAFGEYVGLDSIKVALMDALEYALMNVPEFIGRFAIATDTSGSMGQGMASGRGTTRYIDIAGIFTGLLMKRTNDPVVLPFDTQIHALKVTVRDSVMTIADDIRHHGGGGTAVAAPVSYLHKNGEVVDVFVGITDSVDWARDQYGNQGFLPAWREYKRKIAPNAKAFMIQLAPYQGMMAPQEEPDLFYVYGWSESVLRYMAYHLGALSKPDLDESDNID